VIGSTRTGVDKDKIVVAIHAPVTGAAPLPATSFEKARDLYWRYVIETKGEKILGRSKVEVIFKDDRYQPNTAVQACRELASQAFVLVGGGGTDQIQACGRFANQAKVPYFSAGVTENGLRGLDWYFASSMSYKQQGGLLAQYVGKNFAGKKTAAIITDTPNFDDASAGWEAGVQASGLNYYKTLRHPKGDTSWYNTYANELKNAGVEVLYINSSPVDYIRFAQQAAQQGFHPQFVGVGVTMGLNAVLGSGCPQVDKGIFFSPFPGIDWARQNLPQFFQTADKLGAPADDIGLALWGNAAVFHELLKRYESKFGTDLTREGFRAVVAESQKVDSGVFPSLTFSASDHFGANQVHVLQADCGTKEYKTLATFASGF
jgi:ABC-type branched-subunit amino acid transport system substrate-binding protein